MESTEVASHRPDDFELHREWRLIVDEVERHRSLATATILINSHLTSALRAQFGRHFEDLGLDKDGRALVRITAPMPLSIAEQLAGWGAAVEVIEPDSVKTHLGRV